MAIYLACQAMDPDGPDVFAEALIDLWHPELEAERNRLADRCAEARTEQAPRDAAEGRAALQAVVAAAVARLTALREVRAAAAAAGTAMPSARPDFDASQSGEWLRKHQATCSRTLFRTFDALRKLRRDFGDAPAADEEPAEPPAPGPRPTWKRRPSRAETAARPEALATWQADVAPASHPDEAVEPVELPPTITEPVTVQPVASPDARDVTNEASGPAAATDTGRRTSDDAEGMTDNGQRSTTNEANRPARDADRPVQVVPAVVVALLALLFYAGLMAAFGASAQPVIHHRLRSRIGRSGRQAAGGPSGSADGASPGHLAPRPGRSRRDLPRCSSSGPGVDNC